MFIRVFWNVRRDVTSIVATVDSEIYFETIYSIYINVRYKTCVETSVIYANARILYLPLV